jgi:hypothetical protein
MSRLRGKSRKIFDVKELIGKIFRTKDLGSTASVLWGHARRFSFVYRVRGVQGRWSQFRVMDERWRLKFPTQAKTGLPPQPAKTAPSGGPGLSGPLVVHVEVAIVGKLRSFDPRRECGETLCGEGS